MSEIKTHVYDEDGHTTTVYLDEETGLGVPKHWAGLIQARWDEETHRWMQVWVRMDEG
jgi:hypothetical protein